MEPSRRARLSQNFLWNRRLVNRLVRACSLTPTDLVLEIGSGRGILTAELLRAAGRVIAVELDPALADALRRRYATEPRLSVVHQDFLTYPLPRQPYTVVANLPFKYTGQMLRRLLGATPPPVAAYLGVQREAALKFVPDAGGNTLAALLHYPWWEAAITYHFRRGDFAPPPNVDCVWLRLTQRASPLIPPDRRAAYADYCAHTLNRDPAAHHLPAAQFLARFQSTHPRRLRATRGAYAKLCAEQARLTKIHRTRTDPDWRRFR